MSFRTEGWRLGARRQRMFTIGRLGFSPEWTAGVRKHVGVFVVLVPGLILCAALPYAGFAALYLSTLFCRAFYVRNESLALVLLPEQAPGRFLTGKIGTALRNYFILTAPFALLAAACHPETAWLAAIWLPMSALMLVYFITAKYAAYDPEIPVPAVNWAIGLGVAGFLIPPLLPVTLVMLVSNALRAEKNLNRYLYDYD